MNKLKGENKSDKGKQVTLGLDILSVSHLIVHTLHLNWNGVVAGKFCFLFEENPVLLLSPVQCLPERKRE